MQCYREQAKRYSGLSPAYLAAIRAAVRAELHTELASIFQIQTNVAAALWPA